MPSLLKTFLGALVFASVPAAAQSTDTPSLLPGESVIRIQAVGEIERLPDTLTLTVSIRSDGPTPKAAADANQQKLAALVRELAMLGVSESRIGARGLTASPVRADELTDNRRDERIVGYRAYQSIRVELREIDRLQAIVDRLAAAGAGEMTASFDLDDRRPAMAEAQRKAVANARFEADNLAAALGKRVARLLLVANSADGYAGWRNQNDHVMVSGSRSTPLTLRPAPMTITSRVYVDWSLVDR